MSVKLTRFEFLKVAGGGVAGGGVGVLVAQREPGSGRPVGVVDAGTFDSLQEALDAAKPQQTVLVPARATPYTVDAAIRVPEEVTLLLDATLRLAVSGSIELDSPGATLKGGRVLVGAWGPAWAVRIGADGVVVDGTSFSGSARTSVVAIQKGTNPSASGKITGGSIRNCAFSDTQYAVLKHGTGTIVDHFKVQNNEFRDIVGGDAIEWNEGGGVGVVISGNTINGVGAGEVANAGIGIGLAGNGTGADDPVHRSFVVANNTIVGAHEGIHVEAGCRNFLIAGNVVSNTTATRALTGAGVQVWGCSGFDVLDNLVSDSVLGVGVAEQGPDFARDFKVAGNTARRCSTGYDISASGPDVPVTLRDNEATGCRTGYGIRGNAEWTIKGNRSYASGTNAFDFRPHPGVAAYGTGAVIRDNDFVDEVGSPNLTVDGARNLSYLVDEGNNFSLGSDHASSRRLFFGPERPTTVERQTGDLTLATGPDNSVWLCTSGGSQQGVDGDYVVAGRAGDDHVTVASPGDPGEAFAVGQRVSIPRAGPEGAPLDAAIKRLYAEGSEYRVQLSKPLGSTISPADKAVMRPSSKSAYKSFLMPLQGSGSPEGAVKAPIGSLYLRTDGGPGTTLYVKESGTEDTGWVAK